MLPDGKMKKHCVTKFVEKIIKDTISMLIMMDNKLHWLSCSDSVGADDVVRLNYLHLYSLIEMER